MIGYFAECFECGWRSDGHRSLGAAQLDGTRHMMQTGDDDVRIRETDGAAIES